MPELRFWVRAKLVEWMTLPETVAHICSAKRHNNKRIARRELIATLTMGLRPLGPLRWRRERDDKPPPFGRTSISMPTDTPPVGCAWSGAKIRWSTGRVRDDWGEYKPGKWRVLLISRHAVLKTWPLPSASDLSPSQVNSDSSDVASMQARKRGRRPEVSKNVKNLMREELQKGKLTAPELDKMTEEAMAARYQASRDTCRKARKAVLSESRIVENSATRNSDK
jgi:hypothetical protein